METLKITQIIPDVDQPRKYFNAEKLRTLTESIRSQGVIQPLVVQKTDDGKYMLIDGERRYRAATDAGLKEVPVIIQPPSTAAERLIKQFEVQEQHEAWTLTEKAQALISLSEELGMTLTDTCKALHIHSREASRYIAFSKLASKEAYIRSEIPLNYASTLAAIVSVAERVTRDELKKEFTTADKKRLEARFILSVKVGDIRNVRGAVRLKDTFEKNPKAIEQYLSDNKTTTTQLFLDSGAQGAHYLRNATYSARYIVSHGHRYLEQPDVAISDDGIVVLKSAKKVIEQMLDSVKGKPTL